MLEIEKTIYNTYLRISRGIRNQPYSLRKNFDDFEKEPQYVFLKRTSNMLGKLPHINMVDYFTAPYKVYSNDTDQTYTLEFYATIKALACYKQYMKLKEMEPPDSEDQLQFMTDSFRFILKFCCSHNILLEEYLDYRIGFTPEWMKHYTDRKISIYSLLDFPDIYDRIMAVEEDHRKLLLGDLDARFYTLKDRYLKSTKAKFLVVKGMQLLKQSIKQRQENNRR